MGWPGWYQEVSSLLDGCSLFVGVFCDSPGLVRIRVTVLRNKNKALAVLGHVLMHKAVQHCSLAVTLPESPEQHFVYFDRSI